MSAAAPLALPRLDSAEAGFAHAFAQLLNRAPESVPELASKAAAIVEAVRTDGDTALLRLTNQFDRRALSSAAALEIPASALAAAWQGLDPKLQAALEAAAARIREYAERQKLQDWSYTDAHGNLLGQRVTPLDRAGLYVPGGKAAYPSSVLMNAIPAKVAGVGELVMVTPTPGGEANPVVLAAAHLAGVDRVFSIGGAQAVAALAYGTATIPAVDKIFGPGNAWVAAAKRLVFGTVGIDAIAGPSEILIICDGATNPDWIAMDLMSQAEHDEDAQSLLLSPDAAFLDAVQAALERRMATLPRADIIRKSLESRGALVKVKDLALACVLANEVAAEHLELSVEDPAALLPLIRHAGAIFLGRHTPEAFGDYCAGPNHVLPTSRAARFSNPLGVYEFQKRSSLIACSPAGAKALAAIAGPIADAEGLHAHAASARDRG